MLRSLFGDLYPLRDNRARVNAENDFAATAILEPLTETIEAGSYLGERQPRDILVSGSPADAMRVHFAATHGAVDALQRLFVLYDPVEMWAASVIKALSDASGQPIERIQLRDQTSLAPLATIERTTLPQRLDDSFKVYHADVHDGGPQAAAIALALMERADMAVVIIGPMHSSAVEDLVERLRASTDSDLWRCPELLFLLPVGAHWAAQKVLAGPWPARVHVHALTEPLTSASIVWNVLLAHWNRTRPDADLAVAADASRDEAGRDVVSDTLPLAHAVDEPPERPGRPATGPSQDARQTEPRSVAASAMFRTGPVGLAAPPAEVPARVSSGLRTLAILQELMLLDGLIFVALVDANDGRIIASEGSGPDVERAAQAAAEILQTHRRTLRQMGHWRPNDPVDEVLVTAGSRYHILRALQAHPDRFILAVLDKLRSNLAMTRFRIMEAQQVLD